MIDPLKHPEYFRFRRQVRDYEPPPSYHKGDWIVWVGCVVLLGVYVVFAR